MKKQKTLLKEMKKLLENGDIPALKEQFLRCVPNAAGKYGSNIPQFFGDFHPFR